MIVLQEEIEDYYEAYTHLFKLFNESPLIVCEIMKREREGERKKYAIYELEMHSR